MVIPFGRKRDNIYYLIGDKDVEKEKEGKIKILIGIKKKKKKKNKNKSEMEKEKREWSTGDLIYKSRKSNLENEHSSIFLRYLCCIKFPRIERSKRTSVGWLKIKKG